ncbi:CRISPR-associated protein Cas2 [Bifidobacterium actinocoloniiforme DSM 22766]|uniref:CRISPR-associated protein Cas2 n=1 Tax=Bifidobacterium actinocoloniiforme DSM 22766 TaxID=1437605 RepID=A0A086YYJ4_9BIFI|nr:type I-E CRISPR-associated endoribonuclease Cas2e [Bifidobacterium actinocoloniiforme]AKV55877.1 CRISPR-associated protein Cas2 [Bifidobacterium actinocoloniiforme DSM 22766]KFI39344.1 CRISPR-associated protein Cas2 [Bifidobacterium actinocoloniiforme DSM 22766]
MVVIVLTACPVGLRGDLTRWLFEISPGVFVGHVSARVRDRLWERALGLVKSGRAIMVYSARNEQHLAFKVHRADWLPEDHDGVELVKRPFGSEKASVSGSQQHGWSKASKYRKARRFSYH